MRAALSILPTKGSLYAEMGVPEYWLVGVEARAIEAHREPARDRHRRVETLTEGSISLVAFPAVSVSVAAVLG